MSWGAEDLSAALGAASKYDGERRAQLHLQARSLAVPRGRGRRRRAAGRRRLRRLPRPGWAKRRSRSRAREGFTGKLAIHPARSPIINAAFTPIRRGRESCRGDRRRVRGTARRGRAFGRAARWWIGRISCRRNEYWTAHDRRLHGHDRRTATMSRPANGPTPAKGWGTDAPDQPLRPMEFERRALRPDDVAIKITHAGICHSDLHTVSRRLAGDRLPVDSGPRDRRHGYRDRWRGDPAPGR